MTLLDGELVVDEERDSGKHTYKFLAYDLMALNYSCKVHKPWKVCEVPFGLTLRPLCPLQLLHFNVTVCLNTLVIWETVQSSDA